jgi:hypothetical protein
VQPTAGFAKFSFASRASGEYHESEPVADSVRQRRSLLWTTLHKEATMFRTATFLAAAVCVSFLAASPALADGTSFNFRPGGGGGGGARGGGPAPAPAVSNQQQFFNQTTARQQQFFNQPVFPHSGFSQTQSVQQFRPSFSTGPILSQQVWISPPPNSIVPPLFYSGYQPGFYVAPTVYGNGSSYVVQSTTVYVSPQPTTSYAPSQPRLTFGLIGRW